MPHSPPLKHLLPACPAPSQTPCPRPPQKSRLPAIGLSLFYSPARLVLLITDQTLFSFCIALLRLCNVFALPRRQVFLPRREQGRGRAQQAVDRPRLPHRRGRLPGEHCAGPSHITLHYHTHHQWYCIMCTVQVHHTLHYITTHTTSIRTTTDTTISISTATYIHHYQLLVLPHTYTTISISTATYIHHYQLLVLPHTPLCYCTAFYTH
jgi:hypothetical protein